jgi:hypothetical protein
MVATPEVLTPNPVFATLPSRERVTRVAVALEANGFRAIVVDTAAQAREAVLALLPEGAEVFDASSQTLEALGLTEEIAQSGRYQPVRPKLLELYAQGDRAGMRKIGAAPEVMIGSVHAITEEGEALIASGSGSQLGPYAYSAASVIWVVGTQKLVADIDEGLRRLREYSYPREDARIRALHGRPSGLHKILIVNRESVPERTTVILVNEELGY